MGEAAVPGSTPGKEKRGCGLGGSGMPGSLGGGAQQSLGFGGPSTDPHALLIPSFLQPARGCRGAWGSALGGHGLVVTSHCPHRIPTGTRRRTRWAGRASFLLTTSRNGKGSKLASSSASCREYPARPCRGGLGWNVPCPSRRDIPHRAQRDQTAKGAVTWIWGWDLLLGRAPSVVGATCRAGKVIGGWAVF